MINKIYPYLINIVNEMTTNKCSEIQHTIQTVNNRRFKFHIKELKPKKLKGEKE